jgi:nitrogen fixation protein NifU and related proteins
MADLYSKEVMDHFNNPRNVGEIKDADGVGDTGNPTCGDVMRLYITVKEKDGEEYIEDVKFQTFGCGAAVASSSMVTELVKGKSLKDAEAISSKAVADALGGLPPAKLHCSNLGAKALHEAIKDYKAKKSKGERDVYN